MIPVADARTRILAAMRPTGAETVSVAQGWGRVLASLVVARLTQPPADVSAMDGYAVRAADRGALRVTGTAPAGHPFAGQVQSGEAVRLFTGSVVPEGADSVLLQEDADRGGDTVTAREAPRPGAHIRRAGQDFAAGDPLIPAGTRLGARLVGLAAAANHPWLLVHRRPRVAILATGDEIALPGDPVMPGGIVSSNAHAIAALVQAAGAEAVVLPIARDTAEAIAAAAENLSGVDLLVTTGGASVGDHDLVQAGLGVQGFELGFWQIAMRPGKPLLFGNLRGVPVLGLPGNPVSAFVCSMIFLLPALEVLSGLAGSVQRTEQAVLRHPVRANDHRADHLRARLDQDASGIWHATPFERQDSSMMRVLAEAQCLVLRPPHAPALAAGHPVPVLRLDTLWL